MATNPRYANGHRRRTLRAKKLARGSTCTWHACPWPSDWLDTNLARTLHHLDDRYPVLDEIIPISRGGSPTEDANTRLLHRWCNQQRGDGTRTDPRTVTTPLAPSPGWGPTR